MPRNGPARERHRRVANWWKDRIKAALKVKEDYEATAEDVLCYFKADHGALYTSPEIAEGFMNFSGSATVSVPKVAQMRNALGPRLYLAKPVRTVTPATQDGVMLGLAKCLDAYLNYTPRETKLVREIRQAIDDGLIRGRAILETVLDPRLDVITSRYLPSRDLVFDPDFSSIAEAEWIAIRRRQALWRVERRVGEKWRIKGLAGAIKGSSGDRDSDVEVRDEDDDVSSSNDVVETWTILSKMGVGPRGYSYPGERDKDEEDFVRLEIVLCHEVPLAEGPWEIPYYLDADWPVAHVDFVETLHSPWPQSIMGQVLSLQKAVDLLSSARLTSCKNRDRVLIAGDAKLEAKVQQRIRSGTDAEYLAVELQNPAERISDKIVAIDLGTGSPETGIERQFLLEQMEATTGVTPIITGADPTEAKDRSATATNTRAEASESRVADLKQKVEELCTDAARHEAICVRLMLDHEEVGKFVKPSDIGMFYVDIALPGGVSVPIRDTRSADERKQGEDLSQPVTMELIYPPAANYFVDVASVADLLAEVAAAIMDHDDPRVLELGSQILRPENMDPETGLPNTIRVGVVSAERVWLDTAGISPEELFRELSYEIASGSGQKIDKQAEQMNADYLTQNVLPNALTMGDVMTANQIMQVRDDAYDVPKDKRVQFQPPPPPEQGGESEGGDDEEKGGEE